MKKNICLIAVLLFTFSTTTAFAGTTGVTPDIKLSLKDAIKIMQTTGTRAETAELDKKSDQAIANGYGESVHSINETLKTLELLNLYYPSLSTSASQEAQEAGATKANRKILRLRRDFAKEQTEPNYKAEMNQIEYDTLKVYYGALLAKDNLKTEQDNLKTQEDILKNTKLQYQVGMLAKKDVLSAESAVTSAKSGVRSAETKLEYAKMSFNYLLGYAATQEVIFTDTLNVVSAAAINLDDCVKSAVENRNEIKGANFAVEVHKVLLENLESRYPKYSSTYMKQQIALLSAEKAAKGAPVQIEIDIRNKAAELEDKQAALEAAKSLQAYAQEGYRLIRISYDAGMSTLTELQQAQGNAYKAGLAVSSAISDYDLAVYAFRYAQDAGVQRLPL
jgi:outer membrane protein TolC